MDNPFRSVIQGALDEIKDCILYFKVFRPAERERDPFKRLQKELWIEISGIRLGAAAAGGAHVEFRKSYYDRLPSEEAKSSTRKALLSMLRSSDYSILQKEALASVCSDLGMDEAEQDISFVREASARCMTERGLRRLRRRKEREMAKHRSV